MNNTRKMLEEQIFSLLSTDPSFSPSEKLTIGDLLPGKSDDELTGFLQVLLRSQSRRMFLEAD